MAKYNMNSSIINVNCPEIDKILKYDEPSQFTCLEKIYNMDVLNVLSKLDPTASNYNSIPDALYYQDIANLKQLKKFNGKNGHAVTYKKTIGGVGRFYMNNTNKKDYYCYQNCYNRVRRLLVNGCNKSIDIQNSHIEILKNIGNFLKIPDNNLEILNEYCINRKKILEDIQISYGCDRKSSKEFFLILVYGGSYDTWIQNNRLNNKIDSKTEFMKQFESSLDFLKKEVSRLDVMIRFKEIESKINKKKDYKIEKSALAIFIQEIESKIMTVVSNHIQSKGCIEKSRIHDGILYDDVLEISNDELLIEINQKVNEELGLNIPFSYEDMYPTEDDIKWYNQHKEFLENINPNCEEFIIEAGYDIEAAEFVKKKHKGMYKSCKSGQLLERFVKHQHIWVSSKSDPENFQNIIENHIADTNIIYAVGDNGKFRSYTQGTKNINNCYKAMFIKGFEDDPDFYDKMLTSNKGYLPFLDGVYSFKDKKLYTYEDKPDVIFTKKINRKFPIRNQVKIAEVNKKILEPILSDKTKLDYFLHCLSRSLAGYVEDKKWYSWVGFRNCGKSVLTLFLCNSFHHFVGTFNADQLIYNKHGNNDVARALSWLIPHKDKRLLISNEIKEDDDNETKKFDKIVIRGDLTKKLCSGGKDMIDARADHGREHLQITPQFSVVLCSNSSPDSNPQNALDTLETILFNSKFVDDIKLTKKNDAFKMKNNTIEDDIRNSDMIDAFTLIILDAFEEKRMKTPPVVLDDTAISKENGGQNIDEFLASNFTTIQSKEEKYNWHMSEIKDLLKLHKYKIGVSSIIQKFKTLRLGEYDSKHIKKGDKTSSGFRYLQIQESLFNENQGNDDNNEKTEDIVSEKKT